MWFGTKKGISCFNGTTWHSFSVADGLIGNNVSDIAVDLDGSLWFATDEGVSHYSGSLTSVDDGEKVFSTKDKFILEANYPNPFNSSTTIPYELHIDENICLSIYNVIGKKIIILLDQYQVKGSYKVNWDGFDKDGKVTASGIYYYVLRTKSCTLVRKMLYLR